MTALRIAWDANTAGGRRRRRHYDGGVMAERETVERRDYRAALRKIHAQLNGVEWTPTTTQTIAEIVGRLGEGWEIRPPRNTYDQVATL